MMSYKADRIHLNIFQGGVPPQGSILEKNGVSLLVLAAEEFQDASRYPGVEVVCASSDDRSDIPIKPEWVKRWRKAADIAAQYAMDNKKVLITCAAGLNRSGMVTAFTLHRITGWSGAKIVKHIQECRQGALCNRRFVKYLIDNLHEKKYVVPGL